MEVMTTEISRVQDVTLDTVTDRRHVKHYVAEVYYLKKEIVFGIIVVLTYFSGTQY